MKPNNIITGSVIITSGAVDATLAAETTKVIGTVNISAAQTIGVTGTFWQATQPVSGTLTAITNVVHVDDNAGSLTIDAPVGTPAFVRLSDGTAAITTLPVSGTFWQATQPISGAVSVPSFDGLIADIESSVTATEIKTPALGQAAMVASSPVVIASNQSAVPVSGTFWQGTQPVSLASVPSHAVTNAGTFVVQVDGAALTSLQLIDDIVFAEDAVHTTADKGIMSLTVRKDAAAATSGTDGDYQPPVSNARGATWVAIEDGAGGQITSFGGSGTQYTEDAAAAANPVGNVLIVVREDARAGSLTTTDGDNVALRGNNAGELYVKHTDAIAVTGAFFQATQPVSGTFWQATQPVSGTFWQATQPVSGTVAATQSGTWNVTNVSGTVSLPTGAATSAKQDTGNTSLASIDGKITAVNTGAVTISAALPAGSNAIGKLAANSGVDIGDVDVTSVTPGTTASALGKAEDAAHTTGDVGVMALTVRQDTAAALAGTDADYQPLITDASGRLHVNVGNTIAVGSHAVTNAGTFAVQATVPSFDGYMADILTSVEATEVKTPALGQAAMVASVPVAIASNQSAVPVSGTFWQATQAVSGTFWQATQPVSGTFWQATQPVSLASVPSHAVTNAGTFAVQATLAAGAAAIGKAEDAASADLDVGVPAMAVRKATPANTSGTDGDYEMIQMSAGRLWTSSTIDAALPAGTNAIGKLAANAGVTIGAIEIVAAQTLSTVTTVGTVTTVSTVTNLSQLGGTAIAMNTGTRSAGTQRVTIATDDLVPVSIASVPSHAVTNAGTFAVQAAQSGTWTVQPGNTANTTAWKVDGSAVTQPVSLASVPSHAVTNAGTFAVQASGIAAEDAALSGNPVRSGVRASVAEPTAMSADGDVVTPWADRRGRQIVAQKAATGTLSNVASSATNVTLLAANTSRLGAMIYNDSTATLYVKFGATASATSFTVLMIAGAFYEVPFGYTGIIDGLWASANGSARITEVT